jgi:peptidase E
MASALFLIGGGPGAIMAMRRHIAAAVKASGAARPRVAYLGAASGDNVGFQKMISGAFIGTGARVEAARFAAKGAKASEGKAVLDAADVVFVSGGDVEAGMRALHERGVVEHLRALARQGKPMIGLSAGSLMLARDWVAFPDPDDDAKAHVFECIGAAPVHVDAHSEEDDWSELRTLVALLHRRGDEKPVGHGLTKAGCLRVDVGEGGEAKLTALGTDIPRFSIRDGKVVKIAPLSLHRR